MAAECWKKEKKKKTTKLGERKGETRERGSSPKAAGTDNQAKITCSETTAKLQDKPCQAKLVLFLDS